MSAGHGVAGPPQIFGKIDLHLGGGSERHRIEVGVMFRQQPGSKSLHHTGRFDAGLVVGETLFRVQTCHADIHAWFFWVSFGVGKANTP